MAATPLEGVGAPGGRDGEELTRNKEFHGLRVRCSDVRPGLNGNVAPGGTRAGARMHGRKRWRRPTVRAATSSQSSVSTVRRGVAALRLDQQ